MATNTSSGSPTSAAKRPAQEIPQLTCERCRVRKIKCDKLTPCTSCQTAGATCVPVRRKRLARGRHGCSTETDLRKRVQKLETMIGSMSQLRPSGTTTSSIPHQLLPGNGVTIADLTPVQSPPLGPVQDLDDFRALLMEQVHGIREVIDSAFSNADNESEIPPKPTGVNPEKSDITMLGLNSLGLPQTGSWGSTPSLVSQITEHLCHVYFLQVDPIIKILHQPSASRWLFQGMDYLKCPAGHTSCQALRSAIHYIAACSMTEEQCQAQLNMDKHNLVAEFHKACGEALAKSGLLTTNCVTVLQAFVLYLIARKTHDKSTAVWALVPLAVRLARRLHLDHEPRPGRGKSESFFDQQMRRRLWATICLLDMKLVLAQASRPITTPEDRASLVLPGHISDDDFDPDTAHVVADRRHEVTDTTFANLTYRLLLLGRGMSTFSASSADTLLQGALEFEHEAFNIIASCNPESSPFSWFIWHGTHCLTILARLAAMRPILAMQRTHPRTFDRMPMDETAGDRSQETISESLHLATDALKLMRQILTDPHGEGFRWYIEIQWHVLAVAVSDCLVCTDWKLIHRAWPTIEALYQCYEAEMTQDSDMSLHSLLRELMRSARTKVAGMPQTMFVANNAAIPNATFADMNVYSAPQAALSTADVADNQRESVSVAVPVLHPSMSMPTLVDGTSRSANDSDAASLLPSHSDFFLFFDQFGSDMAFSEGEGSDSILFGEGS